MTGPTTRIFGEAHIRWRAERCGPKLHQARIRKEGRKWRGGMQEVLPSSFHGKYRPRGEARSRGPRIYRGKNRKLLPVARPPFISGYGDTCCSELYEVYRVLEGGSIPILRRIGGGREGNPYVRPLQAYIPHVGDLRSNRVIPFADWLSYDVEKVRRAICAAEEATVRYFTVTSRRIPAFAAFFYKVPKKEDEILTPAGKSPYYLFYFPIFRFFIA